MSRARIIYSDKYNAPFPTALRNIMDKNGITQSDIARAVGKTRQTVSQYVGGISEPGYYTLVIIANYLNVSTDYLLGRTGDPRLHPCSVDRLGIPSDLIIKIEDISSDAKHGDARKLDELILLLNIFFEMIED